MIIRRKRNLLVIGMLAILFVASLSRTAYAYIPIEGPELPPSPLVTHQQTWAGEGIGQASLNWPDYAEESVVVIEPRQRLEGERIPQASLNWADYVEEPDLAQLAD